MNKFDLASISGSDGAGRPGDVTRDDHVVFDAMGVPPSTIRGGKIATYRRLAETRWCSLRRRS